MVATESILLFAAAMGCQAKSIATKATEFSKIVGI